MNKIFNEYGALANTREAQNLRDLSDNIDSLIGTYFRNNELNPVEMRCVQAYLSQSPACAETILHSAYTLRKSKS